MARKTTHAVLTVISAVWVATRRNARSCPRCWRLCTPALGGGRKGRPGEQGIVNLSQLIIGSLLFAAVVRRLLVTNQQRYLRGMPYRTVHSFAATMQHHRGYFQTSNKIGIDANELRMFKKTNLTSLVHSLYHLTTVHYTVV